MAHDGVGSHGHEHAATDAIEVYALVDASGTEGDEEWPSVQQAIIAAGRNHAVVARVFEYQRSELVWTPTGDTKWPPAPAKPCVMCGVRNRLAPEAP